MERPALSRNPMRDEPNLSHTKTKQKKSLWSSLWPLFSPLFSSAYSAWGVPKKTVSLLFLCNEGVIVLTFWTERRNIQFEESISCLRLTSPPSYVVTTSVSGLFELGESFTPVFFCFLTFRPSKSKLGTLFMMLDGSFGCSSHGKLALWGTLFTMTLAVSRSEWDQTCASVWERLRITFLILQSSTDVFIHLSTGFPWRVWDWPSPSSWWLPSHSAPDVRWEVDFFFF